MAGRGRGTTSSLTHSQLQSMGCIGNEMPQVPTAPPPTYPPSFAKPMKFESTPTLEYKLVWKSCFFEDFSYGSKVQAALQGSETEPIPFNWKRLPLELKTKNLKRRAKAKAEALKPKVANIEDHFKALEASEKQTNDDDEAPEKPSTDSENEGEEELLDEELDEDNDYGHNYFDNGEAYNEEDDNLDDGPIY